jgi:hypothetical protein
MYRFMIGNKNANIADLGITFDNLGKPIKI